MQADFDPQPALSGPTIRLRPLQAADFDALYVVAADPLVWEQHPEPTRWQREVFTANVFAPALASGSALVITDNGSGKVIGSSRFYDWAPASRELAIGYTFLARSHWGGATNAELKALMLQHAFRWADTVWFHVASSNWRSRKAMEKIGGRLSHEALREMNGVTYDYSFYRIDAPARGAA
jgi:RimJ/RimL family protein N-acetyltransferase